MKRTASIKQTQQFLPADMDHRVIVSLLQEVSKHFLVCSLVSGKKTARVIAAEHRLLSALHLVCHCVSLVEIHVSFVQFEQQHDVGDSGPSSVDGSRSDEGQVHRAGNESVGYVSKTYSPSTKLGTTQRAILI